MAITEHRGAGYRVIFPIGAMLGVAYLLFAHAVTAPIDHNEHAYIGVASLLSGAALYHDVLFNQMPLSVQTYDGMMRILGPEQILLWARLVNAGLMGLVLFFVYRSARCLGTPPLLSWLGVLFLLFNPIMMGPMKEAGSYMLALSATWGATWLTLRTLDRDRCAPGIWLLIGVLLGLSLAGKLYHLAVWPCYLIPAFFAPRPAPIKDRVVRNMAPLALGCIVGLLPVWVYILRDFELFWFNNFTYHMLDPLYYGPEGIPLGEKLVYIRRQVGLQANVAFLICVALTLALLWRGRSGETLRTFVNVRLAFLASAVFLSVAASTSPNPVWIQHFAFPLPFIVLGFLYLVARLTADDQKAVSLAFAAALGIAMAYGGIFMYVAGLKALRPAQWTTTRVSDGGKWIAERVPEGAPVATLSGLYPVHAGRPLYRELGMGPFLYRTAQHLSEEEQATLPIVSKDTLAALLSTEPPGAVLVGEEGELDDPFIAFAQTHGYTKTETFEPLGLTLYLKP